MNKYFNLFYLSLITSTSAFAANTFSTTPVITSPVNDERDVPVAADLSTDVFTQTDSTGVPKSDPSLQFLRAEWILIEQPDQNTIYFGGQQTSPASSFSQLPEISFQYDIPQTQEMIFNEVQVRRLKIRASGIVELLSNTDEVIATIYAQPDSLDKLAPSALHPFISVKAITDSVVIRWDFSSALFGGAPIFAIETNIFNSGVVDLRLKIESTLSYSLLFSFFTSGRVGVEIGSARFYRPLSTWGSDTMGPSSYYNGFGYRFQKESNGRIYYAELADKNLISEPVNSSDLITSDSDTFTSTLRPFSTYQVYARHVAQYSEEAGDEANTIVYSDLSAPVSFETARSKYRIEPISDSTPIAKSKATVRFVLTNEGTYTGEPQVGITLPYGALELAEDGSVDQELEGVIENGNCVSFAENSEIVGVTCSGISLAPGESASLSINLEFNQAAEVPVLSTICETLTDNCAIPEEHQSVITVAERSSAQGSNGSSSGGGAMLWLTLLTLPLLRLRRVA